MTKQEMIVTLAAGRKLIQVDWADGSEIAAVDELVDEGKAHATPWQMIGRLQAMRRVVTGVQP